MKLNTEQLLNVSKSLDFESKVQPAKSVVAQDEFVSAPFVSLRVISALARFVEAGVVFLLGWFTASVYPGPIVLGADYIYLPTVIAIAIAFPVVMQFAGGYTLRSLLNPMANLTTTLAMWSLLYVTVALTLMLSKTNYEFSRIWLLLWFVTGAAGLMICRNVLFLLVKNWNSNGQLSKLAVIVGGGAPAEQLSSAIGSDPHADIRIIGVFDDRGNDRVPVHQGKLRKLGTIDQLVDFVRQARVDMLLVTLPVGAEERLMQVLKRLWVLPVDIRISAQNQKLRYRPRAYSYVGQVPFLDVFDKPLGEWGWFIKALEDRIIAGLALFFLSPVLAAIALAIKLDSKGPVFFKQRRFGFNNELIEVYKFRSMYAELTDHNAERLATRDDPRITRVGRFIRRTSLDELPQLLNVLNGTLSLVGPRPHATKAKAANQLYFDIVDGYFARHKVKPGITGWAQINGWRGETDTRDKILKRVEHDLYYIENWSLAFDLYILARTPMALFKGENAY